MSPSEYEAQIAAFILAHGVTRCPTACVVRTQATIGEADREALQRRAAEAEIRRRRRGSMPITFGRRGVVRAK
jgi:hypothetical protein